MNPFDPKSTYQEASVASANPIRLVMMVYDRMLIDMQKAVECLHSGNVEARTQHVKHAMECVDHLQGNLNMESGGEAANFLWRFYTHLRAKLLEAQIKQSESILKQQIWFVQQVRGEWDKAERQLVATKQLETSRVSAGALASEQGQSVSTWTA